MDKRLKNCHQPKVKKIIKKLQNVQNTNKVLRNLIFIDNVLNMIKQMKNLILIHKVFSKFKCVPITRDAKLSFIKCIFIKYLNILLNLLNG